MRVLALVTDAYGGRGGIAQFNRNLFKALGEIPECEEVVVYPRHKGESTELAPAVVDFRVQSAGSKIRFVAETIRGVLCDGRYDLVICGHIHLAPISLLLSRLSRAPMIVVAHGIEAWSPPSYPVRMAVDKAQACLAVSQLTRDRLLQWSSLDPSQCEMLPNVFDADRFSPGERRRDLLARYSLKEDQATILTMARLSAAERYKGIDEVMDVLPDLIRHHPELVYVIVGDGDDRERLTFRARSLGITSHVRFTGWIDEHEKADHYRLADAFVMPGRGEGFGIVYLEAMACGVPVVASVLDGSRETVHNGKLGVLVNPKSRNDLIDGILSALVLPKGVPEGLDMFGFPMLVTRLQDVLRRLELMDAGSYSGTTPKRHVA